MKEKRTNVRWMFALAFFFIGVIAYMDRANISYIAKQMMDDLGMTKPQFGLYHRGCWLKNSVHVR